MIRRSTVLAIEVAAGLLATAALGVGLLWWRLASAPMEIDVAKQHVEEQLSRARGGRPVKIDSLQLAWDRDGAGLQVRARGVRALDASGRELTRSHEVRLGLRPERLLLGRVSLIEARFRGGDVTLTHGSGGGTRVAFGPPGAPADIIIPPGPANETLTQRANRLINGLEQTFRPLGAGGDLRALSIDGARLIIVDEKSGSRWRAGDAAFSLQRSGASLTLTARASLVGAKGSAPFQARIVTDTYFTAATLDVTVAGARPQALAPGMSLGALTGLSTPITLKISAGLDRKAGITRLDGDARLGRGAFEMGGGRMELSGGRLRGRYDLAEDTLFIDEAAIAGAKTTISGQAKLMGASAIFKEGPAAPARFEIAAPRLDIEMPGAFSGPLTVERVAASGALLLDRGAVEIEKFEADLDRTRLRLAGRIFWGDDGKGVIRPGVKLDGGLDGPISPATIVKFWPMKVAAGARNWCAEALLGGTLANTRLHVDFEPKDLAGGALRDDKLSLSFDFADAKVSYVDGMTPLTGAAGKAELRGNSFQASVSRASIGELALANGKVVLPRLYPQGAIASYSASAAGDARSVVRLLLEAPIGLGPRLPFDPASITGKGQAQFAIRRPLGSGVPGDATQFFVDGRFDGVGATAKNGDYTISNWRLRALGDDKALVLSGPLALGGSTGELVWTERVRVKANPSSVVLRGRLEADDLVSLGFPILKYAQGPVGVEARSSGVGLDVNSADVRLDFTHAALNLEKGFWKKPAGAPATVRFAAKRQADDTLTLAALEARGGGLSVNGALRVTDQGDLVEVGLTHAVLPGALDGSVTARRDAAGVLQVKVAGDLLNIGPFFAPEPPKAPSAGQMLNTTQHYAGAPGALSPAYEVNADVARLRMRGDAELTQGRLVYTTDGAALTRLFVTGADTKAQAFDFSITPSPGQATGKLTLRANDAGFAVRALTGSDNVKGGRMTADGAWRFGKNPSADINVKMKAFQVVKAPALARLLSSVASLTGMVEALNGQGITFNDLDAPMTMADGKLHLADCRAAGPSLGITAKGAIDLVSGAMDLDGVLVPSYGLNSILGGVPILGDLLVSRKGEGVFGITYSLHGPADAPRVGLNPLSALTPGILRRIFEPAPKRPVVEKAG